MADTAPRSWLTDEVLTAPASAALGVPVSRVTRRDATPITGGAGEALGVWRVTGSAETASGPHSFTLILKGWAAPEAPVPPSAWNAPGREYAAYTSGLLEALPGGIVAPRCYGELHREDGTAWLWLSPMSDGARTTWTIDAAAQVARRLGEFNGAYLAGRPLPDAPWLSRDWLRGKGRQAVGMLAALDAARDHPLVARAYPPEVHAALRRVWDERGAWYATLAALPQTFCHMDAFTRNIFVRSDDPDAEEVRLIDWAFTGIAAVGEEIAALVVPSMFVDDLPFARPEDVERGVFASYLTGLREAGWTGDAELARAGFVGSAVLRYGLGPLSLTIPSALDPTRHPHIEGIFGMPITAIVAVLGRVNRWLVRLADEFQDLQRTLAVA